MRRAVERETEVFIIEESHRERGGVIHHLGEPLREKRSRRGEPPREKRSHRGEPPREREIEKNAKFSQWGTHVS